MCKTLIYESDDTIFTNLETALGKDNIIRLNPGDRLPEDLDQAPVVVLNGKMKWTQYRDLLEKLSALGWPVLFITSNLQMRAHLRALYNGPCDVIVAPFAQKELSRRVTGLARQAKPTRSLSLDPKEQVAFLDDERVELTAQEYALLAVLMDTPNTPQSREHLLREAWGYQSAGETRTVDVHVQRLRKKLGEEFIETVYKCGYQLKLA